MLGYQYVYIDKIHKIRQVTHLPDFMYFIDVNLLGSKYVYIEKIHKIRQVTHLILCVLCILSM